MLVYWLDIVGTAVFAISGVLLAGKLRMDPFGVLVLGVVTAVGGGTIRDMALDHGPVFWVKDPTDLVVAMVTSMLTIVLVRQPRRLPKWMLPVLDAVGLAVFVGIGVNKAFISFFSIPAQFPLNAFFLRFSYAYPTAKQYHTGTTC